MMYFYVWVIRYTLTSWMVSSRGVHQTPPRMQVQQCWYSQRKNPSFRLHLLDSERIPNIMNLGDVDWNFPWRCLSSGVCCRVAQRFDLSQNFGMPSYGPMHAFRSQAAQLGDWCPRWSPVPGARARAGLGSLFTPWEKRPLRPWSQGSTVGVQVKLRWKSSVNGWIQFFPGCDDTSRSTKSWGSISLSEVPVSG